LFDSEEVGFVICSKCGARIRADREWCLRCHEPLVAWKKPEIPLPPVVRALGGGTLIFGLVGAVAAGVIIYLTFFDSSAAQPDQPVRRTAPQVAAPAAASATAPRSDSTSRIEQVTFVDAPRRSTVDIAAADPIANRKRFEETLESNPKDADTLNNLGLTLERLGFVESAVARFTAAIEADRRNWIFHFNLAHAVSQLQNWNRAAAEYSAALELFPDNYAAQYNMGIALHLGGNETEAVKAFEKAIQMAPGDPAAHLSRAISLEASGHPDDAVSEYRRYLQMVPNARDAAAVTKRVQSLSHES
jgi:tetratricopeptide (TPR) repeat protein/ribosomal protein L40E